jgi:uncharacterized protein (DUF2384 family)
MQPANPHHDTDRTVARDSLSNSDLLELVELVRRMVDESGDPEGFDAAAWTAQWVDSSVPALGGQRPRDVMTTPEGRALVLRLVRSVQSGTYW